MRLFLTSSEKNNRFGRLKVHIGLPLRVVAVNCMPLLPIFCDLFLWDPARDALMMI